MEKYIYLIDFNNDINRSRSISIIVTFKIISHIQKSPIETTFKIIRTNLKLHLLIFLIIITYHGNLINIFDI